MCLSIICLTAVRSAATAGLLCDCSKLAHAATNSCISVLHHTVQTAYVCIPDTRPIMIVQKQCTQPRHLQSRYKRVVLQYSHRKDATYIHSSPGILTSQHSKEREENINEAVNNPYQTITLHGHEWICCMHLRQRAETSCMQSASQGYLPGCI